MRKLLPPLMLVFLSLCSLVLLPGCFDTPKEPVMPNWDVELNVPITEKEYKIAELLDPSKNIKIVDEAGVGDSLYVFLVDDIKNTFLIQDDISIPFNPAPKSLNVDGESENGNAVVNAIIYNPEPEYHLKEGLFKSGAIKMNLYNGGSSPVNYELVMPGFRKISDNSIFIDKGLLEANSYLPLTIPLQDYKYTELRIEEGLNDTKDYEYQADAGFFIVGKATPVSGNVNVAFKSEVGNDKIVISKIVGKLKPTELTKSTRTIKTDLGNDITNFTQVDFKDMSMQLKAHTFGEMKNIKIKLDSLSIVGYKTNKSGQRYSPVSLMLDQKEFYSIDIIAGADNPPTTFDNSNSNLQEFIRNLPQVIELKSKAVLNSNIATEDQIVSSKDSITFVVGIEAPLKISATDATFQDTIDLDEDLSSEDKDDIARANRASITLHIENHIPLGATGKATFVDRNYNTLFSIRNKVGNAESNILTVDPAAVDVDGVPTTASNGELTLFLQKDDFQKFKDARYVLVELHMRSYNSPAAYVQVRAKDFIKIRLYGGVNYHLDPEKDDGEGGN